MYLDLAAHIAGREREIASVEKLCEMRLIKRSPGLVLRMVYYKVSKALMKKALKAKSHAAALFRSS
jgi:hypothetical protein